MKLDFPVLGPRAGDGGEPRAPALQIRHEPLFAVINNRVDRAHGLLKLDFPVLGPRAGDGGEPRAPALQIRHEPLFAVVIDRVDRAHGLCKLDFPILGPGAGDGGEPRAPALQIRHEPLFAVVIDRVDRAFGLFELDFPVLGPRTGDGGEPRAPAFQICPELLRAVMVDRVDRAHGSEKLDFPVVRPDIGHRREFRQGVIQGILIGRFRRPGDSAPRIFPHGRDEVEPRFVEKVLQRRARLCCFFAERRAGPQAAQPCDHGRRIGGDGAGKEPITRGVVLVHRPGEKEGIGERFRREGRQHPLQNLAVHASEQPLPAGQGNAVREIALALPDRVLDRPRQCGKGQELLLPGFLGDCEALRHAPRHGRGRIGAEQDIERPAVGAVQGLRRSLRRNGFQRLPVQPVDPDPLQLRRLDPLAEYPVTHLGRADRHLVDDENAHASAPRQQGAQLLPEILVLEGLVDDDRRLAAEMRSLDVLQRLAAAEQPCIPAAFLQPVQPFERKARLADAVRRRQRAPPWHRAAGVPGEPPQSAHFFCPADKGAPREARVIRICVLPKQREIENAGRFWP